jgi:hypothetical protein
VSVAAHTGSITVTALVGTGLATLAVSLTGLAGLGGDLHAAAIKNTPKAPVMTPDEELRNKTTDEQTLILREACDRRHGHGHRGQQGSGDATTSTTPDATTPQTTSSASGAREF